MAKMVRIDQLKPLPLRTADTQVSEELIESIRADGIHYPLIVTPDLEVIDGQKTWLAAGILGIAKVPVVEVKLWRQVMNILAQRHGPTAVALTPVTPLRCWEVMTTLRPFLGFRAAERRQMLRPGEKLDDSNSRDDIADAMGVARHEFKSSIYLYNQLSLDNEIPMDFKRERVAAVEAGLESARTAVQRMYKKMDDLNQERERISSPAKQAKVLANALPEAEALATMLEQLHSLSPDLDQMIKESARQTLTRLRQVSTRLVRSLNV